MSTGAKWGVVSTIKAPLQAIERFAAHHLDIGAARLYIYLDYDDDATYKALKAHPKIRVFRTHGEHWRSRNRPLKHQARQSANARHAYLRKAGDVDWLAHIDVDEFLVAEKPIASQLAALPESCWVARVRPIEALSSEGQDIPEGTQYFKAMTNERKQRQRETDTIYPTYGPHLTGGFLSHVAGKIFVRTGAENVTYKIHNAFIDDVQNPGQIELAGVELCHMHAASFDDWMRAYRYRLSQGAYRAELKPNRPREQGGLTLHELLTTLEEAEGERGLKDFYQEVCTATPELRRRLEQFGLLRCHRLALDEKRTKHFG